MIAPPVQVSPWPSPFTASRACGLTMRSDHIRTAIDGAARYLADHPEKARSSDPSAVAVVQDGLRCRAEGPNGAVLVTDMPKSVGGGGASPTPGWFLRAALATCDATVIAMRAAQLGIVLTALEVTVDSESDNRGLLGVEGAEFPGPHAMRIRVRIAADGVPPEQLHQVVTWAEAHSPVGNAVRRAVPSTMDVEIA
jgi:uncharacterized OsmC-like protein